MSIEEQYNEALRRAKELYDGGNALTKQQMEIVFPQLAESEDERIRKMLIKYFKELKVDSFINLEIPDILAWLEKQKVNTEGDFARGYDCGYECGLNSHGAEWFEKQKEQKPTPNWMPKFLDELRSKKNYFDWDEHRDIEGHILAIINYIAPNYFKEKEQKPAEWSEEDEKMLDSVIRLITHFDDLAHEPTYAGPKWTHPYTKEISWLKSLRPQKKWKPSEEKLSALGSYIEELQARAAAAVGGWNKFDALIDLYADLKKLMEDEK